MSDKNWNDFVFSDGQFLGNFEEMYRHISDPWHQSDAATRQRTRRIVAERLRKDFCHSRVVEFGCGEGHLGASFFDHVKSYVGVDVSQTAVDRARRNYPNGVFEVDEFKNFERYSEDASFLLLSDILWYVLEDLNSFVRYLHSGKYAGQVAVILTFYPQGEQKYGRDFFTTPEAMRRFFDLEYYEYGDIYQSGFGFSSYFIGHSYRAGHVDM